MNAHQQLCYTPSGRKIVLTEKTITFVDEETTIRIERCVMKEGRIFFSKDTPNLYHSIDYIHVLEFDELKIKDRHLGSTSSELQ